MANTDRADGFLPYQSPNGGPPPCHSYLLSATNTEIGKGTPVKFTAGVIDIAAAADPLIGIAAEYKAANAGGRIKVYDDPMQRFVAQCDDGTGTLSAAAGIGLNTSFVGVGVTNKRSTAEIDESEGATTAALELKILEIAPDEDNAHGEFVRYICKINNHQLGAHTGTAGT